MNNQKKINFIVNGNQIDKTGNPIPYLRTTQASQWTDKTKRYQEWKGYVVSQFIDLIQAMPKEERMRFADIVNLVDRKPIKAMKNKIVMDMMIYFKDDTHADCDNIFKGVSDSLFMNDKYVAGSFDYKKAESGKVEITITFL